MSTHKPRPAALALAAALAGSVVLTTAPAAHARVVDVKYDCQTPIGPKSAVSPIDITAVRTGSGNSYTVTMTFQKGVSSSPIELGKGAMRPRAVIRLGGADSGTLAVSGPPNAVAAPANTPIKISDLSGTYTPKHSGKVTFTAGVLTIEAMMTTTTCTPGNGPGPSLSLDVTAAGGGTAPQTTTSGADPGTLPQTGPADSALALGTLGGTVLLAGAAGVLWLTRRGQRSGA
ncbi:LPXTG cell wall anchor domain-containing protein [Streptomyces sp. NRRL S-87]|uniref:LPXTG cell wall anchor domain-containing protein n=1 Tax=Streptomyces sp. NRRL S-87 TaxID=1463920 RepID=UPI0004BFA718|nr:LPXTG cell wall anchor domain-containing protein [Streptomyces sp. NRRL S-87]